MKIGFPLLSEQNKTMFDEFHGCQLLGVYDYHQKHLEVYDINYLYEKSAQHNLLTVFNELEVKIVVCNAMKPMALNYFLDQRITVYKAEGNKFDENLNLLLSGKLKRFMPQMADASSCGSSCSSCSSDKCTGN